MGVIIVALGIPGLILLFALSAQAWTWLYQWPKDCRLVFRGAPYQPINYQTFKAILPFINEDCIVYKKSDHLFQIAIPKQMPEGQDKIWGYYLDPYAHYWLKFPTLFSQVKAWVFYKHYKKYRNKLATEIGLSKNATNAVLVYCKDLLDKEIAKASDEIYSAAENMKTVLGGMVHE